MKADSLTATDSKKGNFGPLTLRPEVLRALHEMNWHEPTSVQLASYEPIAAGTDVIVQSPTGSGKTGAFGIPLIDKLIKPSTYPQALVLAPTRELALQSTHELSRIGKYSDIVTVTIYGGASIDQQIEQLKNGASIISGTPGRILDHLSRGTLDLSKLRIVVLDEADGMLAAGFAKEVHAILDQLPQGRQVALFSATVESGAQTLISRHMRTPKFVGLSQEHVAPQNIRHFVYFVTGKGRTRDLVRILEADPPETAIIFCNTKAETETVANDIQQAGFKADWLNSDLPQAEREKIIGKMRRGELPYLVATDVAARGIDISHISHVINYNFPDSSESYVHRTGRTGRAGRKGTAISLVSPGELGTLYYLRLQHKIFPVERSLPTAGEHKTRLEADHVLLLEAAFVDAAREADLAVARRLLTHPEADRIVAGLIGAFFGTRQEGVEEEAARLRRNPASDRERRPSTRRRARRG